MVIFNHFKEEYPEDDLTLRAGLSCTVLKTVARKIRIQLPRKSNSRKQKYRNSTEILDV